QLREQRKFLGNAFKLEKKLQPEAHQVSISIEKRLLKKFPELTSNDLELITLLLEKSSSKEIAFKMNISPASVNTARYRLRKKLRLQKGQDLLKFLLKFS
ncbi:MAG: LuxR C-terminal-related transcriptional regulator, partial [Salinimicrobium sp.]